ncbi:glycosyltransferase [bacterium]|nr:glycosyltransferase [bacterium]
MPAPGLTVTMIVRNESDNLRELLPVVTAGADDVVVVDTGSTDGSADVARELGARVIHRPWDDDFSAARNRGLDEVRTSHAMWLDADDRITAEDLEAIAKHVRTHAKSALLLTLVNESAAAHLVSTCRQLRVFPARREHRFTGRVHEQVQPSLAATGTRITPFDATVRHCGYASDEEVVRKSRRNLELCRREWEDGRRGIALAYHYVKAAALCGENDEAAEIARSCVESPPEDSQEDILQNLRVTLGKLEWERGDPIAAERHYRDAVAAVPRDAFALLHLGELLRLGGRSEEAVEILCRARSAGFHGRRVPMPEQAVRRAIRVELGRAYECLCQPAEAAAVYREAMREYGDDVDLRRSLARALLSTGEYDEAGELLGAIAGSESANASFVLLKAALAFEEHRDDEARQLYEALGRALPDAPIVPLRLGCLALRRGAPGNAGPLLRSALEGFDALLRHRGPDPTVLTRLGECYQGLAEPAAARMAYEEALRVAPGFPEAQRALGTLGPAEPPETGLNMPPEASL